MYLLNGEVRRSIELSDRGFQYGDGVFETIEVLNGVPVFFEQHLQRLSKGCKRLLIPVPDAVQLKEEAYQISKHSVKAVLKLIVTRGSGGRGYRIPSIPQPTRLFSLHAFPEYPESYSLTGTSIRFCNNRLGLNASLAGIKHMNRLEQIMARSEWNSSEIQEGLMLDSDENVVEGTISNIFVIKNEVIYTPIMDQCGVEGVIRNIIIELAKSSQMVVVEKKISVDEIYLADEMFLTNSIIGIWPIKQLEEQGYRVGLLTKQLQKQFILFKQRDTEQ